jgi:hypothetical protein
MYIGDAQALVEGLVQINVRIPTLSSTDEVGIRLLAGNKAPAEDRIITLTVR